MEHVIRPQTPFDFDCQALARELVDDGEHTEGPAVVRRRFSNRRLHFLLKKNGLAMNQKRLRRLCREEGLQVRMRWGRKRALGMRAPLARPSGPNERWSIDFVSDSFTDVRRSRVLAIVVDYTRGCLALVADTSLSGAGVARDLDTVIAPRGKPRARVSDNASSSAWRSWPGARQRGSRGTTSRRASRSRTPSSSYALTQNSTGLLC
jgi:putative transposase